VRRFTSYVNGFSGAKVVLLMTITLHRSLLVVLTQVKLSDKLTTTDINSIENELSSRS
jgi:hypothetical protein